MMTTMMMTMKKNIIYFSVMVSVIILIHMSADEFRLSLAWTYL